MSYKFDSLIAILKKLDNSERVTVQSLIDGLEVSERTVYRYMQTLQTAGFPIVYDKKRKTYSFELDYKLCKPEISVEESLALALAKKFLVNFGTGMENGLASIENKLTASRAELPANIILKDAQFTGTGRAHVVDIYHAIRDRKKIKITYHTLSSGEVSKRKVDPYFLFLDNESWNLRGYCHLREEMRTFALDQVESMKELSEHFIPEPVSPEEEISGSFGPFLGGKPTEVVLHFQKEAVPYILRKKWHQSQQNTKLDDGSLEVRFRVNGYLGIKRWVFKWLPHVSVKAPAQLKAEIRQELQDAINRI